MERIKIQKHMENPKIANELWFQESEKETLEKKQFKTTIRLGDRTVGTKDPKGGYQEGVFVTLKIQKQKDQSQFDPWQTKALITGVEKKKFSELTPEDLVNGPQDQQNQAGLKRRMKDFYGREIKEDEMVTIIRFEDAENLKTAQDLIEAKALKIAKFPPANPNNLAFRHYTLPLLGEDYPAKTAIMWNNVYEVFNLRVGNVMLVGDPIYAKEILQVLRKDKQYQGGGAGVGFKDEAIKFMDELDPLAQAIGAINFILKTAEAKLKGYNTDGLGYAKSLEQIFQKKGRDLMGQKAVILGAGGTGNAVAFALAEKSMQLVILNRTVAKAEELAKRINDYFKLAGDKKVRFGGEDLIAQEIQDAAAVINVSTKGAEGNMQNYNALAEAKLPETAENLQANRKQAEKVLKLIPKDAILSDIVLVKGLTSFLKAAQEAGFETLDGVPMVVNQGVEAFWLLYGDELRKKNITKEQVFEVMSKAAGLKI